MVLNSFFMKHPNCSIGSIEILNILNWSSGLPILETICLMLQKFSVSVIKPTPTGTMKG